MKRFLKGTNKLGKKNTVLAVVALFLVMVTAVGVSFSWIEEVSHVEFNTSSGQQTPLHVGEKTLNSDAVIKEASKTSTIDLSDYFYKSGGMHLSPCYGDGNNFYFPVEKQQKNQGASDTTYRAGNKDDANVNYLSATFRVRSEDVGCVFWFEKTGDTDYITFEKTDNNTTSSVSNLDQYLRVSVTVDGATNVYALNSNGKFNTIEGATPTVTQKDGRRIDQYTYYTEEFNNDGSPKTAVNSDKANQGATGSNLNGNTVFSVPKYDDTDATTKASTIKTVTVKLWLEYSSSAATRVDVSNINLNLVSSWAKTRRIYVKDETIDEIDNGSATGAHWVMDQNANAYLQWQSTVGSSTKSWNIGKVTAGTYVKYIDIPAVYNNYDTTFNRRNNTASGTVWDHYSTTFPDTFHSETYTIYTKSFGTWESVSRHVNIINSCHYTINNTTQFTQPYAYMWDSSTDTGADNKVVQNASWPGTTMTKLNQKKSNLDIYAFYYNSIFDRIIFNDNYNPASAAYQTEDINLDQAKTNPQYYSGKCYDMATLKWYNNVNSLPTYASYIVYGEFFTSSGESRWTCTRMVEVPNSSKVYCRVNVRYKNEGSDYYRFKIKETGSDTWYGYGAKNEANAWYIDGQTAAKDTITTWQRNDSYDIQLHATNTAYYKNDKTNEEHPGIYAFYFDKTTHQLGVWKEKPDGTHITS